MFLKWQILGAKISRFHLSNNAIVFISYIVLLWLILYQILNTKVQVFPDSITYISLAGENNLWQSFFTGRPVGSVLEFKLFGDPSNFPFIQTLLYSSSILYLLWMLGGIIKSRAVLAISSALLIICFSHSTFSLWITAALTETVFFSLMVMQFSFLLGVIFKKNSAYVVMASVGVVLIALSRDYGAYYAALYGALFGLIFFFSRRKLLVIPVVASIAVFLLSSWSADLNTRWHYSMLNNIGKRIVASEEFRNDFAQVGMPINLALKDRAGLWASEKGSTGLTYYDDPELKDFMIWFRSDSKRAYMKFLIENPTYSLGMLAKDRNIIFFGDHDFVAQYGPEGFKRVEFGFKDFSVLSYFLMVFILAIGVGVCLTRRSEMVWLYILGVVYFAFVFPFAFIGYHADAMEIPRHLLPVPFHMILVLSYFLVLVDNFWLGPVRLNK